MNTLATQWLRQIQLTKAPKTYLNYSEVLQEFDELTPESLLDHIAAWRAKGLSQNTIVLKLTTIRQLLSFMASHGDTFGINEMLEITHSIKGKQIIQEYVTEPQMKKVLEVTKKSSHKAVVALMFYGGCRLSEALKLTVADLREDGFIIRDPKNGCDRFIPWLSKVLQDTLQDHIRRTHPTELLFPKVIQNSFQKTIKRTFENLGYPKLHSHSFRHGMIVRCLENNIDLATIGSLSGHKNLQNIQKYAHVTPKMLARVQNIFQ